MRAKKIDGNQNSIVESLRQIPGVSVAVTSSLGNGFVDTVIGYKGRNYLVEIKDENQPIWKRKLTRDEQKFHSEWKGQIAVCKSFDEVFELIK